jgi:hypothetical protein
MPTYEPFQSANIRRGKSEKEWGEGKIEKQGGIYGIQRW